MVITVSWSSWSSWPSWSSHSLWSSVVSCPTRWSLLLAFGFLHWSSQHPDSRETGYSNVLPHQPIKDCQFPKCDQMHRLFFCSLLGQPLGSIITHLTKWWQACILLITAMTLLHLISDIWQNLTKWWQANRLITSMILLQAAVQFNYHLISDIWQHLTNWL